MTTTKATPEQGHLSPACHQKCHQKRAQRLSVWHYRRNGIYYLRVGPRGCSLHSLTVSLRSTDRPTAMTLSHDILKGLALFHLDRPDATWPDLKERLLDVAHALLEQAYDEVGLSAYDEIYEDLSISLARAAATTPLNVTQHKALDIGREIVKGAHARLRGDTRPLIKVIERLEEPGLQSATNAQPAPPAVVATHQDPITFEELAALFVKERQRNVEASTLRAIESNCRTLSGYLGELDIRTHARADMVRLRDQLADGRKILTVNKLLTQLSTVLGWAKNNGHIERSFDKGLKFEKGAESERQPFTQAEMETIMAYANALPINDWKRWALSLGALTGARVSELYQLSQNDVKQIDGITVIDINKDNGKSVKNSFSVRQVPLVDGAYGFSVRTFLEWVASEPGNLFKVKDHYFNKPANEALRKPLGLKAGGNQSFHSLRHSMTGTLKAAITPEVISQAILGHGSGTITYDLYAGSQRISVKTLHEALVKAFTQAQCLPEHDG